MNPRDSDSADTRRPPPPPKSAISQQARLSFARVRKGGLGCRIGLGWSSLASPDHTSQQALHDHPLPFRETASTNSNGDARADTGGSRDTVLAHASSRRPSFGATAAITTSAPHAHEDVDALSSVSSSPTPFKSMMTASSLDQSDSGHAFSSSHTSHSSPLSTSSSRCPLLAKPSSSTRPNHVYSGSDSEAARRAVHRLVISRKDTSSSSDTVDHNRSRSARDLGRQHAASSIAVDDADEGSVSEYQPSPSSHSSSDSGFNSVSNQVSVRHRAIRSTTSRTSNTVRRTSDHGSRARERASRPKRRRPSSRDTLSQSISPTAQHLSASSPRLATAAADSASVFSTRATPKSQPPSKSRRTATARKRTAGVASTDGEPSSSEHQDELQADRLFQSTSSDKAEPLVVSVPWTSKHFTFGTAAAPAAEPPVPVRNISSSRRASASEPLDQSTSQPMDVDEQFAAAAPNNAAEAVDDPDSRVVSCAVFPSEDWGVESEADAWCFLCEWRVPPDQIADNRYYSTLLDLFSNSRHQRNVDLCRNIQRYYKDNFALAHEHREWTLRSIRAHQYEHMGVSTAFMYDDLIRTLYAQTQLYSATGLRLRDIQTNKQYVNHKGMRSYIDTTRQLLNVIRQAEQ
jgi:hypothetical protein